MSKRKPALPAQGMNKTRATVEPLRIEDMNLITEGRSTFYFKRLKYKGCPPLAPSTLEFKKDTPLVNMQRDDVIRELYRLVCSDTERSATTLKSNLDMLQKYFQWFDSFSPPSPNLDYFSAGLIDDYMRHLKSSIKKGVLKVSTVSRHKHAIAWILKQQGRIQEYKQLPSFSSHIDSLSHQALDIEVELKPVVKLLFQAYQGFEKHFRDNTTPTIHPIFDQELFEQASTRKALTGLKLFGARDAFRSSLRRTHWHRRFVETAILLTYMFTGMNTKPLEELKLRDVTFKQVNGGVYILESVKGRAGYTEIDNALGFNKRAKEFIESWLVISLLLNNNNPDAPLFPFVQVNGEVTLTGYESTSAKPQNSINKLMKHMDLTPITPSRLRKTKLDALMRVTEDIYLVAQSGNHSVDVVKKDYSSGVPSRHEANLAASMDALAQYATGEAISDAVSASKAKFVDVLDTYEYERLRNGQDRSHESRTPIGVRCQDNTKGAAEFIDKVLAKVGVQTASNEKVCTDFLGCFECEQHAFVAEVEDIWLMLSFRDTLQQMQQLPAINSIPECKYIELVHTIGSVLSRYQVKAPENYIQAESKNWSEAHPLYSDAQSLNDMLEVFV